MSELVLYDLRLLAKQFLGTVLDMEVDQSAHSHHLPPDIAESGQVSAVEVFPRRNTEAFLHTLALQTTDQPAQKQRSPPQHHCQQLDLSSSVRGLYSMTLPLSVLDKNYQSGPLSLVEE